MEKIKLTEGIDPLKLVNEGYVIHGCKGKNEHSIFKDKDGKYMCVTDYTVFPIGKNAILSLSKSLSGVYFDKNLPIKV